MIFTKECVCDVEENEVPVEKTADWLKKNGQAKSIIGLLLRDSLMISIKNLKNARGYWETLWTMYEKSSLVNRVFLLKKLCRKQLGSKTMEAESLRRGTQGASSRRYEMCLMKYS